MHSQGSQFRYKKQPRKLCKKKKKLSFPNGGNSLSFPPPLPVFKYEQKQLAKLDRSVGAQEDRHCVHMLGNVVMFPTSVVGFRRSPGSGASSPRRDSSGVSAGSFL